jgi:exopolysaccharide biosynthesis operon protein EpsL
MRQRSAHCRTHGSLLVAALLASTAAFADALDTVNVTVAESVMRDDNLFRLSSTRDPAAVGLKQKSDTVTVGTLGLKLAKKVSLQTFELDASLVDYRYQTFDYLSFTATNYSAAWRWALTPRFHGNLTQSRAQSLNSFADYTGYNNRNMRTDEVTRFDGIFEFGPWHLLAGAAETKRTNSQLFLEEGDSKLDTVEGGLRRVFSSGASISVVDRHGRGDYFKRPVPIASSLIDNGFDQNERELSVKWPITAKMRLDARAARLERKHDHYAARDYSGSVGSLNLNWDISAKTRLTASVAHELGSFQTSYSSYSQTDRVVISPLWQFGAKTGLRLRYDLARRDYLGAVAVTPYNGRSDTIRAASVALEWQPITALFLSASLQGDRRSSNIAGLDYESKSANVAAQFTF